MGGRLNLWVSAFIMGVENVFESVTAKGVEHEPPKAAIGDAKGVEGVGFGESISPFPTTGPGGVTPGNNVLQIYVQIGAFWSANH